MQVANLPQTLSSMEIVNIGMFRYIPFLANVKLIYVEAKISGLWVCGYVPQTNPQNPLVQSEAPTKKEARAILTEKLKTLSLQPTDQTWIQVVLNARKV